MKNFLTHFRKNIIDFHCPLPKELPALRKLWKEAFEDSDAFLDSFYGTAYNPKRCRCVTIDNELAGALYWFNCELNGESIAYIYAVATLKKYRGQGICHKLIENTHMHMSSLGYAYAILAPENDSLFKFYGTLGYKTCCHINSFSCKAYSVTLQEADKPSFSIRKIDKNEYAKIRRTLLPLNGVIQENENLDFLETQAVFYTGNDFLLAACENGDILDGLELLGNKDAAPAIVNVLGFKEGRFRTPFGNKPFAMYMSLTDIPLKYDKEDIYLGLIFD